jgi:hypothetical protein
MFYQLLIKISFRIIPITLSLFTSYAFANNDTMLANTTTADAKSLVAGFGSESIKQGLMNKAPTEEVITIPTGIAQAIYLLSPNSPLVGPLTQNLLSQLANVGKDKANDNISFTWDPNTKVDARVEEEPLKSVDIASLLQPMVYNDVEEAQAKNVINALSGALLPINTLNFNQLIASLGGDRNNHLKAKLMEKQTQEYLAALRNYLTTQTVALGNLYQIYAERKVVDPNKLPPQLKTALQAVESQNKGPLSALQLESFMATRRIIDENWYKGLINDNPATLQREQAELLAENLAESYQTRMTLERLLVTMSVLVLELNQQSRIQMQNQAQSMLNNPSQK